MFPVFIAIVGVVIYVQYKAERQPERPTTATPKEYIEMVEKSKVERIQKSRSETEQEQSKEAEEQPLPTQPKPSG
ncbi:hypothetical protein BOW51_04745 [Solemya velesiana gill symbiont]|uniref:Uncharacterized protein n=1 Tax=Solemya velesiana gill symbiont TaxID=1918948 RepID=A0A1T2KVN4_9GAMM|nr:hypothetical protein BOW51_04745 [Solemya velesiana gill symbiont]